MEQEHLSQAPGTEAWALPCGCWAWSWGGTQSWVSCGPHVMMHNTRRAADFEMAYAGVSDTDKVTDNERLCTCILCLSKKHDNMNPYEYVRLVARQGTYEYEQARIKQAQAKQESLIQNALSMLHDLHERQEARREAVVATEVEAEQEKLYCGCLMAALANEWRVARPCKKHKNEPRASRRNREKEHNERRNA